MLMELWALQWRGTKVTEQVVDYFWGAHVLPLACSPEGIDWLLQDPSDEVACQLLGTGRRGWGGGVPSAAARVNIGIEPTNMDAAQSSPHLQRYVLYRQLIDLK